MCELVSNLHIYGWEELFGTTKGFQATWGRGLLIQPVFRLYRIKYNYEMKRLRALTFCGVFHTVNTECNKHFCVGKSDFYHTSTCKVIKNKIGTFYGQFCALVV